MTIGIGLVVAAVASLALNASYLVQHGALAAVPPVRWSSPVVSLRGLLSSRRWVTGALLSYGGLALSLVAMALLPLWLVQTTIAAGLVAVCVGWARLTGRSLAGRERAAVALVAAALVVLAVCGSAGRAGLHPEAIGLAAFMVVAAAGAAVVAGARRAHGLGLASGVLYGATTVAMAATLGALGGPPSAVLVIALVAGAAVTSGGFFAFQRALQTGAPAPVITQMTAGMNGVALAGGLALGGGLASGWAAQAGQVVAVAALCGAGVLAAGAADAVTARR